MDRTLLGSTLWHGQRSECADLSELLPEHFFLVCVPGMETFTEGDSLADAIEICEEKYLIHII